MYMLSLAKMYSSRSSSEFPHLCVIEMRARLSRCMPHDMWLWIQMGSVADLESQTDVTDFDDSAMLSAEGGHRGAGLSAQDAVLVHRRQLSIGIASVRRLSRSNKW